MLCFNLLTVSKLSMKKPCELDLHQVVADNVRWMSLTKRNSRAIPTEPKHKRPHPLLAHTARHAHNTYYSRLGTGGDLRYYPPPQTRMSNASRQVGTRKLPPLPAPGNVGRRPPPSPHSTNKSSIAASTYLGSQTSSARSRGGSGMSSQSGVRVSISYDMIVKGEKLFLHKIFINSS